jgi:hypothetical protein
MYMSKANSENLCEGVFQSIIKNISLHKWHIQKLTEWLIIKLKFPDFMEKTFHCHLHKNNKHSHPAELTYSQHKIISCLNHLWGPVTIRTWGRLLLNRKVTVFCFQYKMGTNVATQEISKTQEQFPVRVPIKGITYLQRCFRQEIILRLLNCLSGSVWQCREFKNFENGTENDSNGMFVY